MQAGASSELLTGAPGAQALAALLLAVATWFLARRLGLTARGAGLAAAAALGAAPGVAALAGARGVALVAAAPPRSGAPDLVSLGALALAAGAIAFARRHAPPARGTRAAFAIGFALLVGATALALARRGLPELARTLVLPVPGEPLARAWVALPVLGLALAALASGAGPLRGRGACAAATFPALLVALGDPGCARLVDRVPFVSVVAPVASAALAIVGLALLAGDALEGAGGTARAAGALALLALAALAALASARAAPEPEPGAARGDPDDELVVFTERPAPHLAGGSLRVAGRLATAVPADRLVLRMVPRADAAGGGGLYWPVPLSAAEGAWRAFGSASFDAGSLQAGEWVFELRVVRDGPQGEELLGRRVAAVSRLDPAPRARWAAYAALAAAGLVLLALPRTRAAPLAPWIALACSAAPALLG